MRNICVYASSSDAVDGDYKEAARRLGELIGGRGATLVYGAGNVGLMGVCARAVGFVQSRIAVASRPSAGGEIAVHAEARLITERFP